MRFLWGVLFLGFVGGGHAATLHFGANQTTLSGEKHTSPALAVKMDGTVYWGALFNNTAPAGTYLPAGAVQCADCGMGYYCTGGQHRAPCSGGIIACPTTRAVADATTTLVNRVLSADEINTNVPVTDLSQWRQISCCSTIYGDYYSTLSQNLSAVNTVRGCANGVLGPGTYLFTVRTDAFCAGMTDPFGGAANCAYSANIAIFDHAVSYKTIHAENVFFHFLDIDGPTFTGWDFQIPTNWYCITDIRANVTGLAAVPRTMCVYELK
ncbi:MAG: hypothetical protein K2L95_04335 [Alphaproteobacteria bacterium]|nr:hypothetical protein [Alphaproteobacteria bacterium]